MREKKKVNHGKSNDNTTNCLKKSIFFALKYWKYLHVRHNLNVMQIKKNVCEKSLVPYSTFQVRQKKWTKLVSKPLLTWA